jgi:RHS repeat-associated protein
VGNRLTDDKTTGNWTYDQNNELQGIDDTQFKYNLNGQMTEKTVAGVKTTYRYNLDGRLSEIRDHNDLIVAQYQYDPFGRRMSKHLPQIGETIYFHYSKEGLVGEYNEEGSLIQSYGYKPNSYFSTNPVFTHRPDFVAQAKGGYVYYINDHLATPQKLITETGYKVWEASADAFGKTVVTNNEFRNPLRFPGQYKDDESSLRYNYFRYYDQNMGKYITSDPIGLRGGLNTYFYVKGNPIIRIDYFGLLPSTAEDIVESARQHIESEEWSFHKRNGTFAPGKNKCNQFVRDALNDAFVPVPVMNGRMSPPTAGQWADPNVDIPGFPIVSGPPQPGDIIAEAHETPDATGHVGIVTGDNSTVSQSSITDRIEENNWGFRPEDNVTVRRWEPQEPYYGPDCSCDN